jgi:hypothetical protein
MGAVLGMKVGYGVRSLVERFDAKPAEIRRLPRGDLGPTRSRELMDEMRAAADMTGWRRALAGKRAVSLRRHPVQRPRHRRHFARCRPRTAARPVTATFAVIFADT